MIKVKENTTRARVAPPPVLNGTKALKAKPKRKPKRRIAIPAPVFKEQMILADGERECPTCKRPFPMTPAERQRKRRAKIAKLNKAKR